MEKPDTQLILKTPIIQEMNNAKEGKTSKEVLTLNSQPEQPSREGAGVGCPSAADRSPRRPNRSDGQGRGTGGPGETESPPGPLRVAPAEITPVQLQKSSRKPKLLQHNFDLFSFIPSTHSAKPLALPSAADASAPRPERLPVPRARDPEPHLKRRAARGRPRKSPGSMAPCSPSRNFPDIALLSSAAENNAARRRRKEDDEEEVVAAAAAIEAAVAGAGAESEVHRGRAPPPREQPRGSRPQGNQRSLLKAPAPVLDREMGCKDAKQLRKTPQKKYHLETVENAAFSDK
ncbi:uncharacterized protein LOC129039089 [Pongo pygmaeus]|uniref:uncharacterized protein LOC129039089 n=1 Tax=Pongo pygmaeus TaxID=9600 RepID=UPI00300C59C6